jgi:hypothetical protein
MPIPNLLQMKLMKVNSKMKSMMNEGFEYDEKYDRRSLEYPKANSGDRQRPSQTGKEDP